MCFSSFLHSSAYKLSSSTPSPTQGQVTPNTLLFPVSSLNFLSFSHHAQPVPAHQPSGAWEFLYSVRSHVFDPRFLSLKRLPAHRRINPTSHCRLRLFHMFHFYRGLDRHFGYPVDSPRRIRLLSSSKCVQWCATQSLCLSFPPPPDNYRIFEACNKMFSWNVPTEF